MIIHSSLSSLFPVKKFIEILASPFHHCILGVCMWWGRGEDSQLILLFPYLLNQEVSLYLIGKAVCLGQGCGIRSAYGDWASSLREKVMGYCVKKEVYGSLQARGLIAAKNMFCIYHISFHFLLSKHKQDYISEPSLRLGRTIRLSSSQWIESGSEVWFYELVSFLPSPPNPSQ